MTWNDILNRIKDDESINFVAEAMTPLHILGIEALIVHLNSTGIKCKGFILAVSHGQTGLGINDRCLHEKCYSDVSVVELEPTESEKVDLSHFYRELKIAHDGNIFIYATPFKPSFRNFYDVYNLLPERKFALYITEEGGASYVRTPYQLKRCFSVNWRAKDYLSFFYHAVLQEKRYERKLTASGALHRFLLLKRENGNWIANPECAAAYRTILSSEDNTEDYSDFENAVLFSPSLLYESGIMSNRQDIEIYKKIKDALGENKYIVKPHPREKNIQEYNRLDCKIERRYGVSQESIFAHLEYLPKVIIGESGTTLIYAKALFNIKSVAINKLIDKSNLNDKNYFDDFNNNFGEIVYIPDTLEELIDYIKD